jgi:hypothetical protein
LSLVSVMNAFSLDFPWYTPFVLQAMIAIFVVTPVTPGLVGQFHFPIIACLIMVIPEVTLPEVKAVALVAHFVVLIPIAVMGAGSLFLERMSFFELTRQSVFK